MGPTWADQAKTSMGAMVFRRIHFRAGILTGYRSKTIAPMEVLGVSRDVVCGKSRCLRTVAAFSSF